MNEYDFNRKTGPSGAQSHPNTFTLTAPPDDAKAIRELIGDQGLSGFFYRAAMLTLAGLFDDPDVTRKAIACFRDVLTDHQAKRMAKRLEFLSIGIASENASKYEQCKYCRKKTAYMTFGILGIPAGENMRCYSCKREWFRRQGEQ